MLNPDKNFKMTWDIIVLLVTVAVAIETPLVIVFDFEPEGWRFFTLVFVTVVYILDIIINFNTGMRKGELYTEDRMLVSSAYLKGWFWADLLAAIPFELLVPVSPYSSVNRLFRVLKLIRLFKMIRVVQLIRKYQVKNLINPAVFRMGLLIFWILIAAHYIACGWVLLNDNPDVLSGARRYLYALYWTLTTLTTIGYGDITPKTDWQVIYVIFIMLTGAGMYGFIIGNISSLIANIDVARAQYKEKMEKINTFMKYRNIPPGLMLKINDYYRYLWESRRGYDESEVLNDLPGPLKRDVSIYLNRDIIEKVPIFQGADRSFINDIILHLEPVVFTPGDYIVQKGEIGNEMYFISKGSVDVVSDDGIVVYATLTEGSYFGEIALLLSTPRTAGIIAKTYCDLYRLEKAHFTRVLQKYPEFKANVKKMAEERERMRSEVS